MDHLDQFDPALFGTWAERLHYSDAHENGSVPRDTMLAEAAQTAILETKSVEESLEPSEALRRLLNEMTVEMRDQFSTFRRLRTAAEQALDHGDDAAQKLARADVKAATDAMSLIVRTLEKVDALQRQLSRDRALEAERTADEGNYEDAKTRFMAVIEERAHEQAIELFETWQRDGPPERHATRLAAEAAEPAGHPAAGGEGSLEDGADGEGAWPRHGPGHQGA